MRLGKRERALLRKQREVASLVAKERLARANAVSDTNNIPSYLGPLVDRTRDPVGRNPNGKGRVTNKQIAWQYRAMYFNDMARKSKVRVG